MNIETKFKVGDVITAYHKGIHRITSIEPRKGTTPLIYYKKMFTYDGAKAPATKNCCDEGFCLLLTPARVNEWIRTKEREISQLQSLIALEL